MVAISIFRTAATTKVTLAANKHGKMIRIRKES